MTVLARSEAPLRELQARYPKQVQVIVGDLSDFSLAQKAVDLTGREFGGLDGLVINHGVLAPVATVGKCDVEKWKHHFDVNFFSGVAFVCVQITLWRLGLFLTKSQTKAALPLLRKSNGRIVLVSSGAATGAYAGWGPYGASKAALNHLAMTLSVEEPKVTTISIRPGVVDTQMQQELREEHGSAMDQQVAARFIALHKEGGLLEPAEPGNVIAKVVLNGPRDLSGLFLRQVNSEYQKFLLLNEAQLERQRSGGFSRILSRTFTPCHHTS